jgi:hypothetical protein
MPRFWERRGGLTHRAYDKKNHAVCGRCKCRDCARPDRAALVALEMCQGASRQSQEVCDFDIILTAENSSHVVEIRSLKFVYYQLVFWILINILFIPLLACINILYF